MRQAADTTPTTFYKLIGPISGGEAADIRCSDRLYCRFDVTYLVFNVQNKQQTTYREQRTALLTDYALHTATAPYVKLVVSRDFVYLISMAKG